MSVSHDILHIDGSLPFSFPAPSHYSKRQANEYERRAADTLRQAEPYKRRISDLQKKNLEIDRRLTQLNNDYRREVERDKRK